MRSLLVLFLTVLTLPMFAGCAGGSPSVERRMPSGPAIYQLTIQLDSEMSESFRLVGVRFHLGDRLVFEQSVDTEDGTGEAEIETPRCVFRAKVPAGSHEVGVELIYRGRGHGVFSYLRGYRFRVRSTHVVDVPTNVFGMHVLAIGDENGGATTPLEERPRVRWVDTVEIPGGDNADCQTPGG